MRIWLSVFIAFSVGCVSASGGRVPAQAYSVSPIVSADELDLKTLVAFISANNTPTIAKTLEAMKERAPKYLASYTLGYRSSSIQASAYDKPRAIVFNDSGNFIFSFNAGPSVEVVSYNPEDRTYSFREIEFKAESAKIADEDLDFQTPQVRVSKANLTECMSCHGFVNPRPIWQPYFIWPGFYGSEDDNLFRFGKDIEASLSRFLNPAGPDSELKRWTNFKDEVKTQDPHYKNLPDTTSVPYGRPNLALMDRIQHQMIEKMASDFLKTPVGRKLSLPLATIFACGFNDKPDQARYTTIFNQVIPDSIKDQLSPESKQAREEIQGFQKSQLKLNLEILGDLFNDFEGGFVVKKESRDYHAASVTPKSIKAAHKKNPKMALPVIQAALGLTHDSFDLLLIVSRSLKMAGLNLTDYAFNSQRIANFKDGDFGLTALRSAFLKINEKTIPPKLYEEALTAYPSEDSCAALIQLSKQSFGKLK